MKPRKYRAIFTIDIVQTSDELSLEDWATWLAETYEKKMLPNSKHQKTIAISTGDWDVDDEPGRLTIQHSS